MPRYPLTYSKEHVNRAGKWLRDARIKVKTGGVDGLDLDALQEAFQVLDAFRAAHQYPLTLVTNGLRSFVQTETGGPLVVAQRLKRAPQIVSKLERFPKMSLARMEDVGGCRAVLADAAMVQAVRRRIESRWDVRRVNDYVLNPQREGYRGVHLVVQREERRIEVQLRTTVQQEWANALESFAGKWNLPLKDGVGPDRVLRFFALAAEGMHLTAGGGKTPPTFDQEFEEARLGLRSWLDEQRVASPWSTIEPGRG